MTHDALSKKQGNEVPVGKLAWIDTLGNLRDGILVLGSVVYLLGYLSWAVYAFREGLGLVPALDSQFFAAGIFPSLVIGTFIISVRVLQALPFWLKQPLSKKQRIFGRALFGLGLVIVLFPAILSWSTVNQYKNWSDGFTYFGMLVSYIGAFFSRTPADRFLQKIGKYVLWIYLILGSLYLLNSYLEAWFPGMPQEFGGPRPRCVVLDLDRAQFSNETAESLIPTARNSNQGIYQSENLWLIFEARDFLLLKTVSGNEATAEQDTVFKIPKSSVRATQPGDTCNK